MWYKYEQEKQLLKNLNLSPSEYEKKIQEIIKGHIDGTQEKRTKKYGKRNY